MRLYNYMIINVSVKASAEAHCPLLGFVSDIEFC